MSIAQWTQTISDPITRRAIQAILDAMPVNQDSSVAYPVYIDDAFTTGITIAADGTTGLSITSAFSGTNMLSLAGSASGSGVLISGACATPLNITGAFTTGLTIAADGTTAISVTSAFSGATGIALAGTGSSAGINISGNHTTAITIGAQTTAGVAITGATATGVSITGSCSTAALQLGVNGTAAGDLVAYGATTGCNLTWDASADQLLITQTNAATTGVERSAVVSQTHTGIGASAEVGAFTLTTNTIAGVYINALFGKIDLATTGGVTGLAGVVCGELTMPGGAIAGGVGTYAVFEAEINCPTSYSATVPIHVFQVNAWGAAVTQFDQYGYLFDLTGVSSGAGNIWYDNQKAAPAVEEFIRVKTPAGVRYLGLYNANA